MTIINMYFLYQNLTSKVDPCAEKIKQNLLPQAE